MWWRPKAQGSDLGKVADAFDLLRRADE